jgi:hypothetical protein
MCKDVTGSKLSKNLIRESNQRCTVVHGTDNLLVDDNVACDTFGHCFIIEDVGWNATTCSERKCKGWSDEGMVVFEKCVKETRKDEGEGKYEAWEKAYRSVMEKLGHAQRESNEPLQKPRYEPNLALVCEGF